MNVIRPAYPTSTTIVSLADMKEFLRVDHDDEDTTITALLDTAVAHVSDYTNRHIGTAANATFYLSHWRPAALAFGPVVSVSQVVYDDTSGTQQTLDTSKWYIGRMAQDSTMIYFRDVPDLEEYNALPIRITASCGGRAEANIEHAIRMLVAHWYENRRAVVTGTITAQIPMAVESLLNPMRVIDMRP